MPTTELSLYERGLREIAHAIAVNAVETGQNPTECYKRTVAADRDDHGLTWTSYSAHGHTVVHEGWHLDPEDEERFFTDMNRHATILEATLHPNSKAMQQPS